MNKVSRWFNTLIHLLLLLLMILPTRTVPFSEQPIKYMYICIRLWSHSLKNSDRNVPISGIHTLHMNELCAHRNVVYYAWANDMGIRATCEVRNVVELRTYFIYLCIKPINQHAHKVRCVKFSSQWLKLIVSKTQLHLFFRVSRDPAFDKSEVPRFQRWPFNKNAIDGIKWCGSMVCAHHLLTKTNINYIIS